MPRRLYTLFFYLIMPLVLLRLFYRAVRAPDYRRRILERFGWFSKPDIEDCIWVHAVSVGETIAAAPMIKALQQRYPDRQMAVTTMTPTGSERVRALFGDSVFHVYAPYDLPGSVNRFLDRVRPSLLVIMETELWPNTLFCCHQRGVPAVLANGRLSAKSAAGYQRLSALIKPMLANLSMVVAQNQADADRFEVLGLDREHVQVSGSIKFDIDLDMALKEQAQALKLQWCGDGVRSVFVAASTHAGEDEIILNAFQQVINEFPRLLLVLVPRHPERFGQVAALAEQQGFSVQRRSMVEGPSANTQVFIGDTMGELLLFYGCADITFVGGSLIQSGGHNMLEPAAWGLPIITGESDFNFMEISRLLREQSALVQVAASEDLARQLSKLLGSDQQRQQMGESALAVVEANRGSLSRLLGVLEGYL